MIFILAFCLSAFSSFITFAFCLKSISDKKYKFGLPEFITSLIFLILAYYGFIEKNFVCALLITTYWVFQLMSKKDGIGYLVFVECVFAFATYKILNP